MASSTSHWFSSGAAMANTCKARASANILARERFRPNTLPVSADKLTRCFGWVGSNWALGVNSSATPVKCCDTSAQARRRSPTAGSSICT